LTISGLFAYSYTTSSGIISIDPPSGDFATVNATASQPDWNDVLTPVNDNIVLRPIGSGNETDITSQFPATGDHWDKVDEASSDDDGTYISENSALWNEDSYNTTNHSTQIAGGDIQYVEVFMMSRASSNVTQESAYVHIITNDAEYNGMSENLSANYTQYSESWDINPQSGSPWTWSEVDTLQAGIGMRQAGIGSDSLCTQVYTNINFDAPELSGNTPTGDLYEIAASANFSGNLQVRIFLTNTSTLQKAYDYIDMHLYLESSQEAGETPNYQILNLQNGFTTFNLIGITGGSYTLSIVGGTYQLISRETSEWDIGWVITPELHCEAEQR
jgi:hypothetical protein